MGGRFLITRVGLAIAGWCIGRTDQKNKALYDVAITVHRRRHLSQTIYVMTSLSHRFCKNMTERSAAERAENKRVPGLTFHVVMCLSQCQSNGAMDVFKVFPVNIADICQPKLYIVWQGQGTCCTGI